MPDIAKLADLAEGLSEAQRRVMLGEAVMGSAQRSCARLGLLILAELPQTPRAKYARYTYRETELGQQVRNHLLSQGKEKSDG
jgi:hypothetical protein